MHVHSVIAHLRICKGFYGLYWPGCSSCMKCVDRGGTVTII